MSDDAELRTAWVEAVGGGPAELAALDEVVGRHREPQRRYHGVRHVTWVVRHAHALAAEVPVGDIGAITVAAFFHDAVYDPRAHDNEDQSARLAELVLAGLGWAPARIAAVGALVRATATHEATHDDAAVLIDADLAVLGSDPAAYQHYVSGVRAEYAHVDAASWRIGRSAVLRDLLARRPLYATAAGRTRWEARAGANMAAELASL